jgi:hypothetical protein
VDRLLDDAEVENDVNDAEDGVATDKGDAVEVGDDAGSDRAGVKGASVSLLGLIGDSVPDLASLACWVNVCLISSIRHDYDSDQNH